MMNRHFNNHEENNLARLLKRADLAAPPDETIVRIEEGLFDRNAKKRKIMMRIILGGSIGSIAAALIVMTSLLVVQPREKAKSSTDSLRAEAREAVRREIETIRTRVDSAPTSGKIIVSVPSGGPMLSSVIRPAPSKKELELKEKIGWTPFVEQVDTADIVVIGKIVSAKADKTKNKYEIVLRTQEVLKGLGRNRPATILLRGFANQKYRVLFSGGESEKHELDLQDFPKGATRALLITRHRKDGLVCYSLKTLSSYGEDEIPQIKKIIASRNERIAQLVAIIRENAAKDEKICWLAGRYLTKKMKAENIEEAVTVLVDLLNKARKQAKSLHDAIAVLSYSKSAKAHAAVVDIMRSNSEGAQNRRLAAHYSSFFPEAGRRKYIADVIRFAEQGHLESGADFTISRYIKNITTEDEKANFEKKYKKAFSSSLQKYGEVPEKTEAEKDDLSNRLRASSFILNCLGYPEAMNTVKEVLGPSNDKQPHPQIEISEEAVLKFLNLGKRK